MEAVARCLRRRAPRARDRARGDAGARRGAAIAGGGFGDAVRDPARRLEAGAVPDVARRAGRAPSTSWSVPARRCSRRCRTSASIVVSRESHPAHAGGPGAVLPRARRRPGARSHRRRARSCSRRWPVVGGGGARRWPPSRRAGRRWAPVEIVKPGPEGRAPRLVRALGEARRAFLFSPLPGYGIAAVCRACGQPAACAACGGICARAEEGRCDVSSARPQGRCKHRAARATSACAAAAASGSRSGRSALASVPVRRLGPDDVPRLPNAGEMLVGGPDDVRDFGRGGLDLVAILDADLAGSPARASRRSSAPSRRGWRRSRGRGPAGAPSCSRRMPNDPAVQALVRGDPDRFHADETRAARAEAGSRWGRRCSASPATASWPSALAAFAPITLLSLDRRGSDGMLARARPGEGAGVRAGGPRARRSRGRHPRRGRTAPVTDMTTEST